MSGWLWDIKPPGCGQAEAGGQISTGVRCKERMGHYSEHGYNSLPKTLQYNQSLQGRELGRTELYRSRPPRCFRGAHQQTKAYPSVTQGWETTTCKEQAEEFRLSLDWEQLVFPPGGEKNSITQVAIGRIPEMGCLKSGEKPVWD